MTIITENIPECLRDDNWMGTRLKRKPGGKIDKPPYRVRRGSEVIPGRKNNPADRASFDEAVEALKQGAVHALGRVFTADDDFTVVDLDHCRNPATGEVEAWAQEIVVSIPTYWEVSLSGTGLHGICKASKPGERCREAYRNQLRKEKRDEERKKICEVCGEEFIATRRDAKTCSARCKQRAYRRRKKEVKQDQ